MTSLSPSDQNATPSNNALGLIENKYITCSRLIAKTFGINSAIFLEYLVGWGAARDWRFRSGIQITDDTCLSRQEQRTARDKLKDLGVLEEDLRGTPPIVHFKINWTRAQELIDITLKCNQSISQFQPIDLSISTNQLASFNQSIKEGVNGSSETKESVKTRARAATNTDDFAEFYEPYPKHMGKAQAERTWAKLTNAERSHAIALLRQWLLAGKFSPDAKYVPLPSSWLNTYGADDLNALAPIPVPQPAPEPRKSPAERMLAVIDDRIAALKRDPETWPDFLKEDAHRHGPGFFEARLAVLEAERNDCRQALAFSAESAKITGPKTQPDQAGGTT